MINVNNKILWLADYDLDIAPGGAQRSDKIIIDQGKLLGYNILKLNHETYNNLINIHDYDVLITSNLSSLSFRNKNLINDISKHKYHVRLEHDSNEYLKQEDRIKLFGSCAKSIFLSDFHFSFFKEKYGDIFKNVEIVYDPVDFNNFKDLKKEREDKILYAGYMHPLKGSFEFFNFVLSNPNQQFVIAGWTDNNILHHLCNSIKNVEYLGLVKYEEMPIIYNKYKYMFYDPNLNEPFCRSVAEAILCGMFIMTSKENRIGCINEISKIGIEKFRDECGKAALTFWQKI
jgi:glycosyltransferase involved in cell wall biosynthesis